MTIGDNIKKYRKQNKLTQKALGDLIGKSAISIRKYEANDITPSLQVLGDISKALNISINELTDQDLEKMAYIRVKKMIDNLNNDDLITYKNSFDYKEHINNKIPIYDRLEPKQLELVYLHEIDKLKSIIKSKDDTIERLENMINQLLGGGTDGK